MIDGLKGDLPTLAGCAAGAGQLLSLQKLFNLDTPSLTIYLASAASVGVMGALCARSAAKEITARRQKRRRTIDGKLAVLYAVFAIVGMSPSVYRYWYLHSDDLPPGLNKREPEIGALIIAHAASSETIPIEARLGLDPARTSFECSKSSDSSTTSGTPHMITNCSEYAIPPARLGHLTKGHGLSTAEFDLEYAEGSYRRQVLNPAFDGLKAVAAYRGKADPLLEFGPDVLIRAARNPAAKEKFLAAGVLPDTSEWQRLTKDHPESAAALRSFIVEWIGFLDPFFRVSVLNDSDRLLVIGRVIYTATPRRASTSIVALGAFDVPRFLMKIEEGRHSEDLFPPLNVPAKGVASVDMIIRLKKPDPGVTYDLRVQFGTDDGRLSAGPPPFAITFAR